MSIELWTFRDAIERLIVARGAMASEAEQQRCRAAVLDAYREICQERKWRYFLSHRRIQMQAPYETGTVAYSATTGVVTLSDGTWPSWAGSGRIIFADADANTVGQVICKVASRGGDSTITLDSVLRPTADIAAGATYLLYQGEYPLPADIVSLEEIHDEGGYWSAGYVPPDEWMALERHVGGTGRPWYWTIMGDEATFGGFKFCVYGQPLQQTLDYLGYRTARALNYDGYNRYSSSGTPKVVTAAAATALCAFTGGELFGTPVNAVLRLALSGAVQAPQGRHANATWSEQRIITGNNGSGALTLDSSWTQGKLDTTGHFTISDPIDLPQYMLTAFRDACDWHLAQMGGSAEEESRAQKRYMWQLRGACERDALVPVNRPQWWRSCRLSLWSNSTIPAEVL